jgi:hypothetical protein
MIINKFAVLNSMTLHFREKSVSADNVRFDEWDLDKKLRLRRVEEDLIVVE